MPNQDNFRSDITTPADPRFLASRIVRFPEEEILYELIPASFGYDVFDNIELHFYSTLDDRLVVSLLIDVEGVDSLKSHVVSYADDTFKNYIRIDFTKLFDDNNLILPPGDYKIVMNFFANEIGSYEDRKLFIQRISESRTEVQLQFNPTGDLEERLANKSDLREFLEPSFPRPIAIGVAEKIFRSGVLAGDLTEGVTYDNILNNWERPELDQFFENTLHRIRRLSPQVEEDMEEAIHEFLPRVYEKMRELIVIKGDRRIQEDEFLAFMEEAIEVEFNRLQSAIDNRIKIS